MSDLDIGMLKKTATRFKAFADELSRLDRLVEKGGYNPFLVAADLRKLEGRVLHVDDFTGVLEGGSELLTSIKTIVERQQSAQKMAIVNELANGLSQQGLGVSGQLPMLMTGPFNLVFDFGTRPSVRVFLGNRAYLLGKVDMDASKVIEVVLKKYDDLFKKDLDAVGFVQDLLRAYQRIIDAEKKEPGVRVKICRVMSEYVMLQQRKAFFVDPKRENFTPVARVEFACMMYRAVSNRRVGNWEMLMDVAAMGDTKDPLDHLWIPQGLKGQGVNYTTMRFVRRDDE